jgi:threonine/homoserine/homoserine lactone efflux protein
VDFVSSLPAFVLAVVLISVSPGPAMALVVRRAALRGTGGAVPVVLGLEAGLYVWALLAGGGFAALVAASEVAYLVLRVAGAAVLLGLGIRAWRTAWREGQQSDPVGDSVPLPSPHRRWTAFGEGLVVQLANPKAAVLVLAVYPQFVPVHGPVFVTTALLGLLQVGLETALYLTLAAGVARAGSWFRRPRVRRRLEAVSGTVLVALGLRVAVSGR